MMVHIPSNGEGAVVSLQNISSRGMHSLQVPGSQRPRREETHLTCLRQRSWANKGSSVQPEEVQGANMMTESVRD